jgi:predicted transcriptional regulator
LKLSPRSGESSPGIPERIHRPAAKLAAEAVASYVKHESLALDGIARGLDGTKAGRLVPHDAMDEIGAAITLAAQKV